ncbi:MAG TPA: hypothetical protein VFN15_07230 [Solirubrobacterales bacterium]|nr:hypothetical protein [Solirubrobacterales bacterium]
MDETTGDSPRDRSSHRPEGGLAELIQMLLENPWTHQALKMALEARERASSAGKEAMRGVGVPSATDVERIERRLRGVSERLEAVEDQLDALLREVAELRKGSTPPRG